MSSQQQNVARLRSIRIKCTGCTWAFRCPVEQAGRVYCFACESKIGAKHEAETTP